ncbi:Transmembrane protein [Globisporangium polare]
MASANKMKANAASLNGADASFMRIEVTSMLKLVALSFLAMMVMFLFLVVGYTAAPDVSRSDYTSNATRCTSDFSLALFRSCSGHNTTTSSTLTSGSVEAIDELLQLSEDEQVPILSCMFDACTNSTNRPYSSSSVETLQVAHYSFGLNGFKHRNRYFYLQVAFPNKNRTEDHSFSVTMTPHVKGFYKNSSSGNRTFAQIIPEVRQQTLAIQCIKGSIFCEDQYFLRFGEIDYTDYQVDVLFNSSEGLLPINGSDPRFMKTWGTEAFTDWFIGVKIFFLLISALLAIWYNTSLNKLSVREQNLEQGWVATLTVTLIFFNDPFYVVEASFGGNPVKILSVLFHVTFFQVLLLFWLVMLDNLRLQGKVSGVSNSQFFTPKIVYISFFWLMNAIYHGYMKYYANNDPTWDPLATNANFALVQAICGAMSIFYVMWFTYLVLVSHQEIRSRRVRYRYLVLLTYFMVIMAFVGLGSGAISPAPTSGGQWTWFQALFNVYVYVIAYLYAPSSSAMKNARKRAHDHRGEADAEASPVLGEPVYPAPADLADVEIRGVDVA